MRSFIAIVVGVIVAIVMQTGIDVLSNYLYPTAITDMWDRRQVSEAFAARPIGALLLGILAYFLGGLAGGGVGKLISGGRWAAWAPGIVLAAMAGLIAFSFPLPVWASLAMLVGALVGGVLANHFVRGRTGDVAG